MLYVVCPFFLTTNSPLQSLRLPQIVVYAVIIFAAWVIPGARVVITPLKLFTIGWHELCHITMVRSPLVSVSFLFPDRHPQAVLTGGSVLKVSIDPDAGGATIVSGGNPPTILAAGYVGSTIFGGLFIMAGFDTLVSKIMSFVIGIGLVAPLALVRDKLYVPFIAVIGLVVFLSDLALDVHPDVLLSARLPSSVSLGFFTDNCGVALLFGAFYLSMQQNHPAHGVLRGSAHRILVH